MTEATKIMFIGLDSADPGLIREWSAEEALPNLKGLLDTGAWGTALINLYSSRMARGLMNRIMREIGPMSNLAPAYLGNP